MTVRLLGIRVNGLAKLTPEDLNGETARQEKEKEDLTNVDICPEENPEAQGEYDVMEDDEVTKVVDSTEVVLPAEAHLEDSVKTEASTEIVEENLQNSAARGLYQVQGLHQQLNAFKPKGKNTVHLPPAKPIKSQEEKVSVSFIFRPSNRRVTIFQPKHRNQDNGILETLPARCAMGPLAN